MGLGTPHKEELLLYGIIYMFLPVLACISSEKKWALRLVHSFSTKIGSLQMLGIFCPSGPVSHQGCGSLHAKMLQCNEQPLHCCSCRTLNFMRLWTLPLLLTITSWLHAQWLAHSRCPINIEQMNDILFSSDTPGNYWNQLVTTSQGHCVEYCSNMKYELSFLRTQVCQRNL